MKIYSALAMAIKYNCALRRAMWGADVFVYYDGTIELLEDFWNNMASGKIETYFYWENPPTASGDHFVLALRDRRANDWQTIGNYRFIKEGADLNKGKGEVLEVF